MWYSFIMKKKMDEKSARMFAEVISKLLKAEREKPKEPTSLELLEKRIKALNAEYQRNEGNHLLQKQILLQLKTAMKKRDELKG